MEKRGRGHDVGLDQDDADRGGVYDRYGEEEGGCNGNHAKSVEGWVIFIRGVHEEAQEDDILDSFSEYGHVSNIAVNLDRRTGFVKGYALVEYHEEDEAAKAISEMDGQDLLGQTISVDWAFVTEDGARRRSRGGNRR
eukprot:162260_1